MEHLEFAEVVEDFEAELLVGEVDGEERGPEVFSESAGDRAGAHEETLLQGIIVLEKREIGQRRDRKNGEKAHRWILRQLARNSCSYLEGPCQRVDGLVGLDVIEDEDVSTEGLEHLWAGE